MEEQQQQTIKLGEDNECTRSPAERRDEGGEEGSKRQKRDIRSRREKELNPLSPASFLIHPKLSVCCVMKKEIVKIMKNNIKQRKEPDAKG